MTKLLFLAGILFVVYRFFIKPYLVPAQANQPLDQLQDILQKLQQQQRAQSQQGKAARHNPPDDEYTDYEEIK